ncbi:LysR family transcriptional regulator [Aliisedimentitalea scapharcae]|uniref:LysR family transcriptional regulator n=1 Tax=Aliisedimentitalea scapharcae TaxID=1524259 RepID=A0ABZ2XXH6_9RHOB
MNRYRKSLPPLDSLLFLNAVANNRSLNSAADELFVTQAAVSKRIHRLEEWLGTPLFSRDGRALQITEAGAGLAADVEIALDFLERAIDKVKAPEQPVVRVAANAAVSMFWLYGQLKEFSLSDSSCNVNVSTSDSTADLLSDRHDLVIFYCDGQVPGWKTVNLLGGDLVPAATPEIARKARDHAMFETTVPAENAPALLEYAILTPEWVNWKVWLKRMGRADISAWPTIPCNSYVHSVGKALKGEGVVLANSDLLDAEFQSGRLVRIGDVGLTPKKSYFLCYRENAPLSQSTTKLRDFLISGIHTAPSSHSR